ncbi:TPA: hypothetical protein QCV86_003006 [Bacillus thuringiensis]|nr:MULTISPECIES: hypothetical protein [Bacillus cereus group]KLA37166.1 hypothetical protein B4158_5668 [Bacillus cereus]MBG9674790.1 hypothetical protein [Bacillus thuringiensis]MBU0451104.1 hypothetical protein [Bacillus thuringiensis]MCC3982941.1 hypothetical protein [Bacillus thuringiensis serovar kurstaki]MCR6840979.1 hypothetical protein [Bacillus thuringiensis]
MARYEKPRCDCGSPLAFRGYIYAVTGVTQKGLPSMYRPLPIKGLEKGEDLFCWHCRKIYEIGKDQKGRIVRVN